MKGLEPGGKIVQQIARDGVVETSKATPGIERINARDVENSAAAESAQPTDAVIAGAADRILTERRASKKRARKKANAEIFKRSNRQPETSKLKFTEAERKDPAMTKAIKKSDSAAQRYERARSKTPKEEAFTVGRVKDTPGGKPGTRLSFRERDKLPNGKLQHALQRPGREAALLIHSEVRKSDNSGVQASHSAERVAEGAARKLGQWYRSVKLQPHRAALRAEKKAVKANVNALYKRSLRTNPELRDAGAIKKAAYKRRLKKHYAKKFRQGNAKAAKKTAITTRKLLLKIKLLIIKAVKLVILNWKVFLVIGAIILLIALLLSGFSACMSMFGGGFNTIIATSYTAEDIDILGVDSDYTALESALAARIENIESEFPGYDEYRYNLDQIGHDPFVMASYLTARFNMYTRDQVQAELAALFAQQYTLMLTPVVEIRYRTETRTGTDTWTDEDGNTHTETYTYEVEVPYEYHILYVTLVNRSLETIALNNLTPEEAEMYHVYLETLGNRPELFEGNPYARLREYLRYEVPPEALSDAVFAAMLAEAERHLGLPYVWGGSHPSTGFDCSGYVSWVINNSGIGYNVGRMGAKALSNWTIPVSPADARPGDLVFFWRTYNAPDPNAPTHVGIYVGNGMMIHTGNPTSYASITTNYWVNHFWGFGRLP